MNIETCVMSKIRISIVYELCTDTLLLFTLRFSRKHIKHLIDELLLFYNNNYIIIIIIIFSLLCRLLAIKRIHLIT